MEHQRKPFTLLVSNLSIITSIIRQIGTCSISLENCILQKAYFYNKIIMMIIIVAKVCRALVLRVLIHIITRTLWGSAIVTPILQIKKLSLNQGHKDLISYSGMFCPLKIWCERTGLPLTSSSIVRYSDILSISIFHYKAHFRLTSLPMLFLHFCL